MSVEIIKTNKGYEIDIDGITQEILQNETEAKRKAQMYQQVITTHERILDKIREELEKLTPEERKLYEDLYGDKISLMEVFW